MPAQKVRRAIANMRKRQGEDSASVVLAILERGLGSLLAFVMGLVIGTLWIYLVLALITILATI